MDKATFLATLEAGRAEWEGLLARVDMARMCEPGVEGAWSVKDIVAHILWSEREMVGLCETRSLALASELWRLPQDERNAIVFEQWRDRPLEDVLREEQQIYARFLAALQTLSDEDFVDPQRFRGMPADWIPWQIFAGSSYRHYSDHLVAIRNWLH